MNFNGKEQGDEDGNGNANEDIDTANSYDLFFRRKDNAEWFGLCVYGDTSDRGAR